MDKLFDTKRRYIGYDGEEYINMCIPVLDISKLFGNGVSTLTKDENGRLDTFVWKNVAKDFDAIDAVMYANHIFNPFSVKEGNILNIPANGSDLYVESDEPSLPDGSKFSNSSRGEKTMSYAEKIEYLAKKGLGVK